ncbi:cytochrome P450 4c21 isoform X1 [Dermatophagoides farinae]|uniref:cytochrome P450 4c21 isoform X1 n=1 Tax=Dermatophagoides farinae TaxID=6954 RepID=UPI003F62FEDF
MLIIAIIMVSFVYTLIRFYRFFRWFEYEIYEHLKRIPDANFSWWKIIREFLLSKDPYYNFFCIINRLADKYESVGIFRFLPKPATHIIVTDPVIARKILTSGDFLDKSMQYQLFRFLILDNLFSCNRDTLRQHKREMSPHFRMESLNFYFSNVEKYLKLLNENIDKCIDDGDGRFKDAKPIVASFIADTIGVNFFNIEFNSIGSCFKVADCVDVVDETIHVASKSLANLAIYFTHNRNLFLSLISRRLTDVCHRLNSAVLQIITNRIKENVKTENCQPVSNATTTTLLDTLIRTRLNDGNVSKIEEIRAHINLILIAGYDTTKTTLTWCLYQLGHHQQIQERLYNEIRQFLNELDDNNEKITIMNMKRLKFLECCILETLRLYPPGLIIGRCGRRPLLLANGMCIPAGVNVLFNLWKMGRNPKYFKQPDMFNPERFLTDTETDHHISIRAAFLPFSAGIRSCIGKEYAMMQMRLFLINIIGRYMIQSLDNYGDTIPEINMIHPAAQFPIQFQRRN